MLRGRLLRGPRGGSQDSRLLSWDLRQFFSVGIELVMTVGFVQEIQNGASQLPSCWPDHSLPRPALTWQARSRVGPNPAAPSAVSANQDCSCKCLRLDAPLTRRTLNHTPRLPHLPSAHSVCYGHLQAKPWGPNPPLSIPHPPRLCQPPLPPAVPELSCAAVTSPSVPPSSQPISAGAPQRSECG